MKFKKNYRPKGKYALQQKGIILAKAIHSLPKYLRN